MECSAEGVAVEDVGGEALCGDAVLVELGGEGGEGGLGAGDEGDVEALVSEDAGDSTVRGRGRRR